MSIPKHIKEHAALGISPATIANINASLYDRVVIDMDSDNYTMTAAESRCSLIYVFNPGDGSKVLTIGDYNAVPLRCSVYVQGSSPIGVKFSGENYVAPAFPLQINQLIRFPSLGMVRNQSQSVVYSSVGGTTTDGNTSEQVIEQMIIPARCIKDAESVNVECSLLKSNTATTETLRVRIGNQGDATDVQVWVNAGMATTAVGLSMSIKIQRVNATTVAVVSTINSISQNALSALSTSFQQVTVDDMDASPVYISITGQNSTGAETVTSKFLRGMLSS